jgi:hypothetical protein
MSEFMRERERERERERAKTMPNTRRIGVKTGEISE